MTTPTHSDQSFSVGSAVRSFLAGLKGASVPGNTAASSSGAEDKFFADLMAVSQKYAADLSRPQTSYESGPKDEDAASLYADTNSQIQKEDNRGDRRDSVLTKNERDEDASDLSRSKKTAEKVALKEDADFQETDVVSKADVPLKADLAEKVEKAIDPSVEKTCEQAVVASEVIFSAEQGDVSAEGAQASVPVSEEISDSQGVFNREDMEKAALLFLQGLQARQVEDKGSKVEVKSDRMIETDAKIGDTTTDNAIETTLTKQDALAEGTKDQATAWGNWGKFSQKNDQPSVDSATGLAAAASNEMTSVAQASVSQANAQAPEERSAVRRHDDFLAFVKESQGLATSSTETASPVTGAAPVSQIVMKEGAKPEGNAGSLSTSQSAAQVKGEASSAPILDGSHKTTPYSFASQLSATRATRGGSAGLPSPVEQVALFLNKNVKNGQGDQLTLQLKPEELGRIDIKLRITTDQQVQGTVIADSQATLDLLKSDSSALERALQNAGLQADSGCLQFSLRGDGQSGSFQRDQASSRSSGTTAFQEKESSLLAEMAAAQEVYYVTPERVNLRV